MAGRKILQRQMQKIKAYERVILLVKDLLNQHILKIFINWNHDANSRFGKISKEYSYPLK